MRLVGLSLLLLLACGDDDDAVADAGTDAPPSGNDLCEGRPCRTAIRDQADWLAVSEANDDANRCDIVREGKYLIPARPGVALDTAVFQDVKEVRFHVEFMRTVLGEYFPALTPARYAELVQRRATREYYAGAIYELRSPQGWPLGWGFDVIVDPTDEAELLSDQETWDLLLALSEYFPADQGINYAPREPTAIEKARGFQQVYAYFPRTDCLETRCDDPASYCLEIPAAVDVCGQFGEGRSPAVEHELKVELELAAGDHKLPRTGGADLTLFSGGRIGQERVPLTPVGSGRYEVEDESGGPVQIYRQRLSDGTREYQLQWHLQFSEFSSRVAVEEPWLSLYFYADLQDHPEPIFERRRNLGSCASSGLEEWEAVAQLAGGDSLRVVHRYLPPLAGSGPLVPVRAEVTLGGESFVVEDYYDLVYAGVHHNWDNQFWVLFDEPRQYAGHAVYGLWLDEAEYGCCPLDGAYTMGANLEKLDTLTVQSYTRQKIER